jgi:serine O-acetyltransferase
MPGLRLIARTATEIRRDVTAAQSRDPAARDVRRMEILATWPGVHALLAHRVAHALYGAGVPLLPRSIAALSRSVTGIEIHPAARIGDGFFIDHGMGVVIGETAEIGDNVTLYQGVTLGGTGFSTGKRHPTVEDNVTIGSGAKLLGPITVGHGSKIGANSVVIHDVPPNTTVVGNPGHPVRVEGRRPEGPDADWIHLPDPIADAIKGLASRIAMLEQAARESDGGSGGEVRALRAAGGGREDEGQTAASRPNPSLGPNPAGG